MKTLFLIPARGGSKGLPGKNIRPLDNKPLIGYSIEIARLVAQAEDVICVSTDSYDIKRVSEAFGISVPFIRPDELSNDKIGTFSVIKHALDYYKALGIAFENVMLLQPTSPIRNVEHLNDVIAIYNKNPGVDMVVSVKEVKDNPYFNLFEENQSGYLEKSKYGNYLTRQDCPKVYAYNGSIYLINVRSILLNGNLLFRRVIKYTMESRYSIDIDTLEDFEQAERILKNQK